MARLNGWTREGGEEGARGTNDGAGIAMVLGDARLWREPGGSPTTQPQVVRTTSPPRGVAARRREVVLRLR